MQEKVLKTLEYDKIAEMLKAKTVTCAGAELAEGMEPYDTFDKVKSALAFTAEAETVIIRTGRSPVDSFPDMRECLKRIHAALFVSPSELMGISRCLRVSRLAKEAIEKEENVPLLSNLAGYISTHRSVEEEIDRCILGEDEIFDGASPELSRIRRSMRQTNDKVRERLGSMIRSAAYSKYLQEPLITIRNGRFVIPVKQEYRQNVPGLIHDQSGSGATLFIEPAAVVELGNQYKKLIAEEQQEIERILSELTAMVAPYGSEINENIRILGEMDLAFAKAKLARDMNATEPKLNHTGYIRIVQGRHPLIPKETVRPIDIWLGRDFRTLIITGPNTGGKTVTLKTVGLFVLMTQSGMFIPADIGSEISVFDSVYADIGDEQSIEQSLSTFSAHMTNIIDIMAQAGDRSLVLIDELGAGTDPIEGAALAMAVLESLHFKGAKIAATTHYAELKAYALETPRVENGCCEFNVATLSPTYRLLIGVPGRSNALAICERLGMDMGVVDRAKELVNNENVRFEDVVDKLEENRRRMEEEHERARELTAKAKAELERAEKRLAEVDSLREAEIEKAKAQAAKLTQQAKRESYALLDELDRLKKEKEKTKDASDLARRARAAVRKGLGAIDEAVDPVVAMGVEDDGYVLPRELKKGDAVLIADLGKEATVLSPVDRNGNVEVLAGAAKTRVKLKNLRLIENAPKKRSPNSGARRTGVESKMNMDASARLDVRGLTVDDCIMELDRYIDYTLRMGLGEFTVVHGKGTGALRSAVNQYLRKSPYVKRFRLGVYGEGEDGVTIVELK